jgi:predicted HAD superfamily Cof-like phosphohydrolase
LNGGALIDREDLIELLEATIEELKRNASFEGRIQYTCMHEETEGGFVVRAFVRTGNDMGQGSSILVAGPHLMDAPPLTVRDQVLEFHQKIGQPIVDAPAVPSDERIRLRARLVSEEAIEFLEALFKEERGTALLGNAHWLRRIQSEVKNLIDHGIVNVDFPAAVDALADIDYVVTGSAIEFGVDMRPIAAEVHRANMEKQGGPRREDGKVLKPPGWKPPNIDGELKRQGWEP